MILNILLFEATQWSYYLQNINQIAQIIGVILIILYVYYTYQTFNQIKKQTDYQQDAYLKLETLFISDLTDEDQVMTSEIGRIIRVKTKLTTKYVNTEFSSKMTNILKPIFKFEDNLFEGNYFVVQLINYGNAEINSIKLHLSITISISKEVAEEKMLKERETHTFDVKIDEILSRNGGKLKIPLFPTASFPTFSISVSGQYYDIRSKRYNIPLIERTGVNDHFNLIPKILSSQKVSDSGTFVTI